MRVISLSLRNFRNYSNLDIELFPTLNLFLGQNGQGKTNLLEAVSVLALSASPRSRRDSELIGPGGNTARISARVESAGRERDLQVQFTLGEGGRTSRRIEIDGVPKRASELPGVLKASLFWPEDLSLIKAGPESRRRLLNQLLVQVDPSYTRALIAYRRVLQQRNHLLRTVALGDGLVGELEVWDEELARWGGSIVKARAEVVEQLRGLAADLHAELSGGEELSLSYVGPPADLLGELRNGARRKEELARGATTIGPHRDDVLFLLNGREARGYASQGQQRTAVVALKLAEAAVLAGRGGEEPVLLFDDVLSELDASRRDALLGQLRAPGQVIITSVDAESFPSPVQPSGAVRQISAGRVL